MNPHATISEHWNRWVLLAAILVAGVICLAFWGILWLFQPAEVLVSPPSAHLLIIPAPTLTETPSLLAATPTPTGETRVVRDGITVGGYVQITNTGGDGLRLRSGPGRDHPQRFLGLDAEVFEVRDGPIDSGGFTWWFLVSPYDVTRSGWAASNYLSFIATDVP
ncbi:MAG: hypothetical protein U1B80_07935 [Anaerolineaceae bacterium]|nr:hypothetical protein [Anaerolineaceae bacterium]